MHQRVLHSLLVIIFAACPCIFADHDPECDEAIDPGLKIELEHKFPIKWLQAGHIRISNPILHVKLQSEYPEHYAVHHDEFTVGVFCALRDGVYTTITAQDNGAAAEYSTTLYKCRTCKSADKDIGDLSSGTGLKIGQSKSEVQALLGIGLKGRITTLSFEETEDEGGDRVWHSQTLRLEFCDNTLCRLTVSEFRER